MESAGDLSLAAAPWNRWITLAAGIFGMLVSGPIFTFGAIHSGVKTLLDCSEMDVQLIGVAGDVGLWVKVIPGLFFDRYGARATLIAGSVIAGVGYTMMYFGLEGRWSPLMVAFAWLLCGEGSGFIYLSTLFASTKNFAPSERGYVTGVLACAFGMSAAVLSSLLGGCLGGTVDDDGKCTGGFLGGSVPDYMKLLAILVPVVGLLAAACTQVREGHAPGRGDHAGLRFKLLFAALLTLIGLVFGIKLLETFVEPSMKSWANYVLIAFLALFLVLPIGSIGAPAHSKDPGNLSCEDSGTDSESCGQEEGNVTVASPVQAAPAPVVSAFQQRLFWSLFFAFGVTVGSDLMMLNIISAEVRSRHMRPDVAGLLLVVQMGFDTLARLSSGFLVGKVFRLTTLLVVAPMLTTVAQAFLAFAGSNALYPCCALLGLSDGIMWTAAPLYVGRMFGMDRVGQNFGIAVLSAAIFQSILSLALEPALYRQHLSAGAEVCWGAACFSALHWIAAAVSLVAVLAACDLHRTWLLREAKVGSGKSSCSGSSTGDSDS